MAYSIALRITTDPTLAEDVVQEAFLGPGAMPAAMPSPGEREDVVPGDRPPSRGRCGATTPADVRAAGAGGLPAAGADAARHLARGGGPARRDDIKVALRAERCPARGDRARLLRRPDPAGDRHSDEYAARHRQEPHAPRAAGDAAGPYRRRPGRRGGIEGGISGEGRAGVGR